MQHFAVDRLHVVVQSYAPQDAVVHVRRPLSAQAWEEDFNLDVYLECFCDLHCVRRAESGKENSWSQTHWLWGESGQET